MSAAKLHIISFDIPYPADYGGVIDVYYKIKSLAQTGVEIYLHCFEYGRAHSEELAKLCKEVWYYPRKTGIRGVSPFFPYIVYSRRSDLLLQRLVAIDAPILFEGVHTTFHLKNPALAARFKMVRIHNIEHQYYAELAKKESSFFKKEYLHMEANLLRTYELTLDSAQAFISMTEEDGAWFSKQYPSAHHVCIRGFHPYSTVISQEGLGKYCLYHGNLGHPENEEAALFLLNNVFRQIDIPLIIAGRNPGPKIVEACATLPNCTLIANPVFTELDKLLQEAHIHVLPTFQATGLKLKLLYALFAGRHVLVNNTMLHGTGLAGCCTIAEDAITFRQSIIALMQKPFSLKDKAERTELLSAEYSNKENARGIIRVPAH